MTARSGTALKRTFVLFSRTYAKTINQGKTYHEIRHKKESGKPGEYDFVAWRRVYIHHICGLKQLIPVTSDLNERSRPLIPPGLDVGQ